MLDFVTSDLRDDFGSGFLGASLVFDFLSPPVVSRENTELALLPVFVEDLVLLGVGGKTSLAYFDVVLVGVRGADLLLSSCAFSSLSGVFVIVRLLSEVVLTESPISMAVIVQSGLRIKLSTLREISGVSSVSLCSSCSKLLLMEVR